MYRLYQVYDNVAELVIGPIMVHKHDGPATRTFHQALSDPNQLGINAKDYVLCYIGMQDESTGLIQGLDKPQVVAVGAAWIESQKPRAQQLALTERAD